VQSASLNLQQQLQQGGSGVPGSSQQQQQQQQQQGEMGEDWLNNLDTRFGGDDLAAFVAGNSWSEFGGMGGWLSTVWGSGGGGGGAGAGGAGGGPQATNAL
jgi:hypothetical protein